MAIDECVTEGGIEQLRQQLHVAVKGYCTAGSNEGLYQKAGEYLSRLQRLCTNSRGGYIFLAGTKEESRISPKRELTPGEICAIYSCAIERFTKASGLLTENQKIIGEGAKRNAKGIVRYAILEHLVYAVMDGFERVNGIRPNKVIIGRP